MTVTQLELPMEIELVEPVGEQVAQEQPVALDPVDAIVANRRMMVGEHGNNYQKAMNPQIARQLIAAMTPQDWFEHSGRSMEYGRIKDPEKRSPELHEKLFSVEGLLRVIERAETSQVS